MNAIFINSVAFVAMGFLSQSLAGGGGDDFAGIFIPLLETEGGERFLHAEVIKADPNGLLFYHSKGIAKIKFDKLSRPIREQFAYDEEEAKEFVAASKPAAESQVAGKVAKPVPAVQKPTHYILIRLPATHHQGHSRFPGCNLWQGGAGLPYPQYLANYHCRKLAEKDFLITTGLILGLLE